MLAPLNCRSENVGVVPIVVPELKLGNVKRQIFAADFVIAAHDAALQDRPEALDCVGMDRTDDMLTNAVVDFPVRVSVVQSVVSRVGIGAKQTDFVGNCFADKFLDCRLICAENDASDDIALAPDRADDWRFERIVAAPASAAALVPMAVFVFPADIGFVDFNDAAELLYVLNESGADLVAHEPSGFVGTEAHVTHDLEGAHSLFASQHQVDDFEPVTERLVCVFEDRPGDMRKPITVRGALLALPMPPARLEVIDLGIAAPGAMHAIGPPTRDQIGFTGFFVGEGRVELRGAHLVDGLRSSGHGNSLSMEGYCHA